MKMLNEMIDLTGQTETITAVEMRKLPGEILEQASLGKTYIVTKNGKPIAQITKVEKSAIELGAEVRRLGDDRGGY